MSMNTFVHDILSEKSTSRRLDDDDTKRFDQQPIPGTKILSPGFTLIAGEIGSGKTTLMTSIIKRLIDDTYYEHMIVFFSDSIDKTFSTQMKSHYDDCILVQALDVRPFMTEYMRTKRLFFSVLNYLEHGERSPPVDAIFERCKTDLFSDPTSGRTLDSLFSQRLNDIVDRYSEDYLIQIGKNKYHLSGMDKSSRSCFVFDDVMNFRDLFMSRSMEGLELLSQLRMFRHILGDLFVGSQSLTSLTKDFRRAITNIFLGRGIPVQDVEKNLTTLACFPSQDVSPKEFLSRYRLLQPYEWVFINRLGIEYITRDEDGGRRVDAGRVPEKNVPIRVEFTPKEDKIRITPKKRVVIIEKFSKSSSGSSRK